MLDILEDYCGYRGYSFRRLDGTISATDRMNAMHEFQSAESNIDIFLLSTRAGGLGINLTRADTVIIFDSDWNPHADLQAQDRCHRIGQKKTVMVYRLATAATVEEKVLHAAKQKLKLEQLVVSKGKFKYAAWELGGGSHPSPLLALAGLAAGTSCCVPRLSASAAHYPSPPSYPRCCPGGSHARSCADLPDAPPDPLPPPQGHRRED